MKVYFKNSKGQYTLIGKVDDVNAGMKMAMDDLKVRAPHFKSYYQRTWQDDDGTTWLDVGSWSEFYVIKVD